MLVQCGGTGSQTISIFSNLIVWGRRLQLSCTAAANLRILVGSRAWGISEGLGCL